MRSAPPLRAHPALPSPATARRARRNANLAEMSEAERENKIITASDTLEYLVHGHWEPTEGHVNGRYGAWWVDIFYILKSGLKEQFLLPSAPADELAKELIFCFCICAGGKLICRLGLRAWPLDCR